MGQTYNVRAECHESGLSWELKAYTVLSGTWAIFAQMLHRRVTRITRDKPSSGIFQVYCKLRHQEGITVENVETIYTRAHEPAPATPRPFVPSLIRTRRGHLQSARTGFEFARPGDTGLERGPTRQVAVM